MSRNLTVTNHRLSLNLTQEGLAELVGVGVRTVQGWESGETACPKPAQLRRLLDVTGALGAEDLGFAPPGPCPRGVRAVGQTKGADEVLLRRELLRWARTGVLAAPLAYWPSPHTTAAVGQADVELVRQTQELYHRVDLMMGGGAMRPEALLKHFGAAMGKLHGRFRSDSVRREMHAAVARLSWTTGWMLEDQGEHANAQRVLMSGFTVAEQAGSEAIRNQAHILGALARQAIYRDDYDLAFRIMTRANELASKDSTSVQAMVHARTARILGGRGDYRGVVSLSRRAEEEYTPDGDYGVAEGYGVAELRSDLGHAYYSLVTRHGYALPHAEAELTSCMAACGRDQDRSRTLAGVNLVKALLAQGEGERARTVAEDVFPRVGDTQSSRVVGATLDTWRFVHARRGEPGVDDVGDMLRQTRLST